MDERGDLASLEERLKPHAETVRIAAGAANEWEVHGVTPALVCAPADAESLAAALAECDRAGAGVLPWGGGTQRRLGTPPRRADVALSTRRLRQVVDYEPANLTVTVEAGLTLAELQHKLGERGQFLPYDPPVFPAATVGGLLATNPVGPRRLRDGSLRDLVIGTRVAGVDGALARAGGRVVKNVTGYDLNKLHIGALGTLGVLVEATFKVIPLPPREATWLAVYDDATSAAAAAADIVHTPLAPTALEILNHQLASRVGWPVPPGRWALVARASGPAAVVERHTTEFAAAARRHHGREGATLAEAEAVRFWKAYQVARAGARWSDDALTCRLAVPAAAVGWLCLELEGLGGEALVWGQALGAAYWSLPAGDPSEASALVARVRRLATRAGGAAVVENWRPAMGRIDVWGTPAAPLMTMEAIKREFDPRGALNPGRFAGGI